MQIKRFCHSPTCSWTNLWDPSPCNLLPYSYMSIVLYFFFSYFKILLLKLSHVPCKGLVEDPYHLSPSTSCSRAPGWPITAVRWNREWSGGCSSMQNFIGPTFGNKRNVPCSHVHTRPVLMFLPSFLFMYVVRVHTRVHVFFSLCLVEIVCVPSLFCDCMSFQPSTLS